MKEFNAPLCLEMIMLRDKETADIDWLVQHLTQACHANMAMANLIAQYESNTENLAEQIGGLTLVINKLGRLIGYNTSTQM